MEPAFLEDMNGNVGEALHSIRHLLGTRSMLQSGRRVCTVIAPLAVQVEIFGATGIFLRREAFFNAHPCNETNVLHTVCIKYPGRCWHHKDVLRRCHGQASDTHVNSLNCDLDTFQHSNDVNMNKQQRIEGGHR